MVTSLKTISAMSSVELLESSPHFSGLNVDAFERISRLMVERRVDKDEIIWLDGEPGRVLYFVASGLIKLFKISAEGKEQIVKVIRPGESFGDSALFDINGNTVSAQAMVPCLLYGIEKNELEALVRQHPQLALNMIKVLARQIRHYTSLVENLRFKPVISRLARILLEYGREVAAPDSLNLTQEEMAAMVGTVREVIGRSLKTLEKEGIIRLDRSRIIIRDSQALRQVAG